MPLLHLLLSVGTASASILSAPKPVGLHPMLIGDPISAQSPLRGALELQAVSLLSLTGGGGVPSFVLSRSLSPAADAGKPIEKAAALVAARLIVDRPAAEAFFAARPELANGALGRLGGLAQAGQIYREGPTHTNLARIAERAALDPSISWLFDGSVPQPELDGLERRGTRLWSPEGRGPKLRGENDEVKADHPRLPGAELVGLRKPRSGPENWLAGKQQQTATLSSLDAGPRWLGEATLPERRRGSAPHPTGVVEKVYGKTAAELTDAGKFRPEEYRLVQLLLAKLARGRVRVEGLGLHTIMIGHTLADPERRAYVVSPDGVLPMPPDLSDAEALTFLESQMSFVRLEVPAGAEPLHAWPQTIQQPLGDALRQSVRQPVGPVLVPFLRWVKRLLGGGKPLKQLPP